MPELRKDPLVGRWVIIATERARRPGNFVEKQSDFVDMCDRDADENKGNIVATFPDNSPDNWQVRVTKHPAPILSAADINEHRNGMYEVISSYGIHEIITETPDKTHNMADLPVSQIEAAIKMYARRLNELRTDERLEYGYVYKNYQAVMNGSCHVSHSQIVASAVLPLHVQTKLRRARSYYALNRRNLYKDLLKQEMKEGTRVVHENEVFVCFMPYAARFVFETCIMPKEMHADFADSIIGKEKFLADALKYMLVRFKEGLGDPSYTFVINTSPFRHANDEEGRWKTIEKDFCWHIELSPRLTYVAGFEKGTGFHICSIPPEETAAYLKELELA